MCGWSAPNPGNEARGSWTAAEWKKYQSGIVFRVWWKWWSSLSAAAPTTDMLLGESGWVRVSQGDGPLLRKCFWLTTTVQSQSGQSHCTVLVGRNKSVHKEKAELVKRTVVLLNHHLNSSAPTESIETSVPPSEPTLVPISFQQTTVIKDLSESIFLYGCLLHDGNHV